METRADQVKRIFDRQFSIEVESFLEQVEKVGRELSNLYTCWESLSPEDSNTASFSYPFQRDLLELIANYWNWLHEARHNFAKRVKVFFPTVTVGQLKEILSQLEDDVQVVVEKTTGYDWLNIREIELPDNESMFTLTLHTAEDFKVTQL